MCNLSLRTIQRIESHEVTPRSHTIKVIFSGLNYGTDSLFTSINPESHADAQSTKQKPLHALWGLFDLRTNTAMKLSVLFLIVVLAGAGIVLTNNDLQAQKLEGWHKTGSKPDSYNVSLDKAVYKSGNSSALIESNTKKIKGFGTLMQSFSAKEYLGKRIKMTGYIRSKDVNGWAGMWLRVDSGRPIRMLSFDNMQDRSIKGDNDWTKCDIVLDVPEESSTLNFGVLLSGTGKVWFDNISFEAVDKTQVEVTKRSLSNKPTNLDFGD